MDDCLFCKILQGEIPCDKIYEDTNTLIFKDISPQAPIHFLAIPRKHIANIHEVPDDQMSIMSDLMGAIKNVVDQNGLAAKGYRLVINSGSNAGQAVFHIHVHILSGRNLQWPPG